MFLYPEQALRTALRSEGERTPAGRVYLEAALQAKPDDHQLRLVLAQTWLNSGCYRRALLVLNGFRADLPEEVQREFNSLRYEILKEQLQLEEGTAVERESFKKLARIKITTTQNDQELSRLEYDTATLGLTDLAKAAGQRRRQLHPAPATAQATAETYRNDATAAFTAMEQTTGIAERRSYFLKGVRTLQAGNLTVEALKQGERHLGPLAEDQETLMVMTRIALAAGKPEKAQTFIRRALGMTNKP